MNICIICGNKLTEDNKTGHMNSCCSDKCAHWYELEEFGDLSHEQELEMERATAWEEEQNAIDD